VGAAGFEGPHDPGLVRDQLGLLALKSDEHFPELGIGDRGEIVAG
jgi:hypothetical protein